jgi:hypothetical protein
MAKRGRKKTISKVKGPLALYTLGEILVALFTAVILGLSLLYFQSLELTASTMLLLILVCFIGIIVAKVMISVADAYLRTIK